MLVEVRIRGTLIPADHVIADVVIRSGRTRADDGLSASSATIEIVTPDPAGAAVNIADVLEITIDGHPRFHGRISEITRAASSHPTDTSFTIVAVGPIARLPRVQIALPLPATNARARISSVLAAAGIPAVLEGGDAYALAAYGVAGDPPVGADEVIGAIITDTGVVVADLGDGSILCQFLDSRTSSDEWTPDPEMTYVDVQWEQTDELVNDIAVEWPGGAAATASSPGSITTYDRHAVTLNTGLGSLAAAQQRASSIIARLALPTWQCGAVETWDAGFFDHGIGAVVTIAPLTSQAPVPGGSWEGVLEGWEEQYGPSAAGEIVGTWILSVSDRAHSAETVSWANVSPPTLKWNQVNPGCSWQEATSNSDLYP